MRRLCWSSGGHETHRQLRAVACEPERERAAASFFALAPRDGTSRFDCPRASLRNIGLGRQSGRMRLPTACGGFRWKIGEVGSSNRAVRGVPISACVQPARSVSFPSGRSAWPHAHACACRGWAECSDGVTALADLTVRTPQQVRGRVPMQQRRQRRHDIHSCRHLGLQHWWESWQRSELRRHHHREDVRKIVPTRMVVRWPIPSITLCDQHPPRVIDTANSVE